MVNANLADTQAASISLINQDPDPAVAGDIVEVRLGIENIGGSDIDNLIVNLGLEYPFTLVPGESNIQEVGSINKFQDDEDMKIIKYKLKVDRDATQGDYELKINYYEKDSQVKKQKSLNIAVTNKDSAEVIHIDQTTLIPGKQSGLKFTVNNVGNAPLRDLTFYWENEDDILLPVGSDNTKYIKYVEIGDSAQLEYQVIADTNADPGLYKLDLHLKYDDPVNGGSTNISTIAGIYIGGATDFDVAFSESSAGETSFSIANIGSNPASSVSVMIPKQEDWKVSGSNAVIIGNLNTGDYTVASFTISSAAQNIGINSDETSETKKSNSKNFKKKINSETTQNSTKNLIKTDTILIQISYTDTMGVRTLVEKEVPFSTETMNSANGEFMVGARTKQIQSTSILSTYKWYLIGLVALIILNLGYKKYKKEKLANPNFKLFSFNKKNKIKLKK